MLRINLLGKKKHLGPLGIDLDDLLSKLGYQGKVSDLLEFRPALIKIAVVLAFYYVSDLATIYWLEEGMAKAEAEYTEVNAEQEKLAKELESKKEIRKQMTTLIKEEGEVQRQVDIINSLSANRGQIYKTVERVGALMPKNAWIETLDFNDNGVKVNGGAWDYTPINDFVKGLTETSQFSGVNLLGINAVDPPPAEMVASLPRDKQQMKTFNIEFRWAPVAAPVSAATTTGGAAATASPAAAATGRRGGG